MQMTKMQMNQIHKLPNRLDFILFEVVSCILALDYGTQSICYGL